MPGEQENLALDATDYSDGVRRELNLLLSDAPAGEWCELELCSGPYGCLFSTEEESIAAGVRERFCPDCRVIRVYKPR